MLTRPIRRAGSACPFFFLNNQFTQIDLEIGQTQSVNAYLPLTRSSEFGPGPIGILNQYFNQPSDAGYYHENSTSHTSSATHLTQCSVAANTDFWVAQERVVHQLNTTHNLLSSWDFDDHEDRRILPRGMNLRIRGCTRPYNDRSIVAMSHNANAQQTLRLVFDSMRVIYTTVKIPHSHRSSETIESLFATIDTGLRSHALVQGQRSATIPITHTDADIVPGVIVLFVADNNAFNTVNLTQTPSVITSVPNIITSVRCNLNGNGMPDFMSIYMESVCNPTDMLHRCAMINAFLGRAGNMTGRSRQGDRSPGETHLMSYTARDAANAASVLAINAVILCTDPSTTVVREAGSGVLTGRLDVQIELGQNILNTHRIYALSFCKQQIGIGKVREQDGTQPQYVLSVSETRPAYTRVTVEEMSY
ncbi:ORF05R [Marbled eel polyomavirus]|uniref:ORF05R n=1 Tax=Marbled eel polyomavirus TaxID=1662286 RepID=UPI0007C19A9E|nr:ORF05R [Marbled eel polyomavirus]ANC70195.1 ORF05R [Marbled eel polyomavirus]